MVQRIILNDDITPEILAKQKTLLECRKLGVDVNCSEGEEMYNYYVSVFTGNYETRFLLADAMILTNSLKDLPEERLEIIEELIDKRIELERYCNSL